MIPQLGLLLATAAAFAPTRISKYSLSSTRLGATPLGANLPLVITTIDARPVEGRVEINQTGASDGPMSATTPISVMCHSMGNFVLKKFAPDDPAKVRFKFHNIYMVAADVRSTTFDKDEVTGDGADILSICGKKVHVLWNWWDLALLGRRALNSGRRALGKVGDEGKQGDGKLIADASKLVYRESSDFNELVEGFLSRRSGHGYQDTKDSEDPKKGALAYYLAEL